VLCSRLIVVVSAMCEKCRELDQKIEHCNRFIRQGFDALTMERLQNLIAELEQQKKTLHD
jgi:hypothetical protein